MGARELAKPGVEGGVRALAVAALRDLVACEATNALLEVAEDGVAAAGRTHTIADLCRRVGALCNIARAGDATKLEMWSGEGGAHRATRVLLVAAAADGGDMQAAARETLESLMPPQLDCSAAVGDSRETGKRGAEGAVLAGKPRRFKSETESLMDVLDSVVHNDAYLNT